MASQYLYNIKGRNPTGNNRCYLNTKISVLCLLTMPWNFIEPNRLMLNCNLVPIGRIYWDVSISSDLNL